MEVLTGIIFTGVLTVQSIICLIHGCRTNERIDRVEKTLQLLSKTAAIRIERIERSQRANYYPPGPYVPPVASAYSSSAPSPSAPSPSAPRVAPLINDSQPKYNEDYSY